LNDDLTDDSVEIPMFIPLQEIESMVELKPQGFYIGCPHCKRELRINGKYVQQTVSCKFCSGQFQFDLANPLIETIAYYARCPHCENELRMGRKYAGLKVACKECGGKIQIVV
jgi:transcription elongation factor Elf1